LRTLSRTVAWSASCWRLAIGSVAGCTQLTWRVRRSIWAGRGYTPPWGTPCVLSQSTPASPATTRTRCLSWPVLTVPRDFGCPRPRSRQALACSSKASLRRKSGCSLNSGQMRPRRTGSKRLWPGLAWRQVRRGARGRRCAGLSRPIQPTFPSASRCAGCGTRSNTGGTFSVTCPRGATGAWWKRWRPASICAWA
jgi:hypothetical protein